MPIPGNTQGHIGLAFEQQDPVEDHHAHCRDATLDDFYRALLAQTVLLLSV